jgi:hypothetical protein
MRGAIGFETNYRSTISRLIRWFSKSVWSHTFIVTDDVGDHTYVMEANEFGTTFMLLDEYQKTIVNFELWEPIATPEQIEAALKKAQKKFVGQVYGYLQLLGIGLKILVSRYLGHHILKHNPIKQGAICSQVVWYYLQELMPDLFGNLDQYSVSPGDLYEIVSKSDRFKKVPNV